MPGWVSFAEIKARVSLEQVLRSYRVDWLRHSGPDQYRGRCPIHGGEGQDAFHVNVKRSVFHCFACGAGGNLLDFVAAREACSVREAALRLQQRYSLPDAGPWVSSRERLPPAERKLVTKKREVNPPLSFSLRLNGAHPYLAGRGLRPATTAHFGLGFCAGSGLMSGRIAIPIHDEHGQLIAYCGRAVHPGATRYRFPLGFQKSRALFNYHRACGTAPGEHSIILVEGFFDCLPVHQAGFPCVAGLMGATLSEAQRELIVRRFSRVVLLLDGDDTGRAATARIAATLRPACAVTELSPGSGCQPDQLPADQIRQILGAAGKGGTGRNNSN